MKILSVKMRNIRSHENTKIEFEDGITLFSGRTGSGKSSILIAIEYALFGSKAISANSEILKRNANSGRVELEFSIYGKTHKIIRGLKRVGNNIQADPDALEIHINGEQFPIMARVPDLDKKILEILKFPDNITRPLELFQIVSYAKQDEIRKLINLTAESRQEHIDNMLQLAKYKNTYNNMRGVISTYQNRVSEIRGAVSSYEYVKEEVNNLKTLISSQENQVEKETLELENSRSLLMQTIEKKEILKNHYQSLIEMDKKHSQISGMISQIDKEMDELEESRKTLFGRIAELEEQISKMEGVERVDELQVQRARIEGKLFALNNEIESLEKEFEKISKLKANMDCPTCEQEVSKEHIVNIKTKYENKIHDKYVAKSDLEISMRSYKEKMEEAGKIDSVKAELMQFKQKIKEIESKLSEMREKRRENEIEISEIKTKLRDISEKKNELESLQKSEIELSKKVSSLESSIQSLERNIAESKLSLNEKKLHLAELEQKMKRLEKTQSAIKMLENLREDIKNIREIVRGRFLLSLKNEFQRKFEELRKHEEDYSVDIKPNYEPVCFTSDGEEVPISNLSGGEKTTVALAYRLALSNIAAKLGGVQKTEVLMLDEPTVGLDREDIKELPNALRNIETIPQIILVTHVPELKEAADHIYLVEKNNGGSIVKVEYKD